MNNIKKAYYMSQVFRVKVFTRLTNLRVISKYGVKAIGASENVQKVNTDRE